MSTDQLSTINRTLGQIKTNLYNPFSITGTDHIVGAILQSSQNVANTNGTLLTSIVDKLNTSQNSIMDKLINLDNSFNQANNLTMQKITDNDLSIKTQLLRNLDKNDNYNIYILEKLAELSFSFNLSLSNKTTSFFEKLIDAENTFNLALLEHDVSLNTALSNNTQQMLDKMLEIDLSFNSTVSNNSATIMNRLIDLETDFNIALLDRDLSYNTMLSNNVQTLLDKLIDSDLSNNKAISDNLTTIVTKLLETEERFNNALIQNDNSNNNNVSNNLYDVIDRLVSYDISLNNNLSENTNLILNKMANFDISFNNKITENTQSLLDKLTDYDISFNLAIVEQQNKMIDFDCSNNELQLSVITGINHQQNTLWNKLDTILNTLIYNEKNANDNICNLFEQLNLTTTDTQNQLTKYIGQYVVLPLYKQRLNDIYVIHIKILERDIITEVDKYLKYFKDGDFESLKLYFTQEEQLRISSAIYQIRNDAFNAFLKTTPEATSFEDMTEEALTYYNNFKKHTAWAYKSLDSIVRGLRLYNDYSNLELLNDNYKIDNEILNDNDKLNAYIEELHSEAKKKFSLFETKVEVDIVSRLNIKPEYLEYIKRYGLPDDLQWESEKLSLVIRDLISTGIISGYDQTAVGDTTTGNTTNNADESKDSTNDVETPSSNEVALENSDTISSNNISSDSESVSSKSKERSTCDTSSVNESSSDSDDKTLKASQTLKAQQNSDSDTESTCESDSKNKKIYQALSDSCPSSSSESSETNYVSTNNEFSKDTNPYYVYIHSNDSIYDQYTYYYPLYLSQDEATKNIDISNTVYNNAIDISGNVYSPNDAHNPTGITRWTFPQFPSIEFWQPNSHPYRSIGTRYHPPLALEWVMFTNYIGTSLLDNELKNTLPKTSQVFELGNVSYFNETDESESKKAVYFTESSIKFDFSFNYIKDVDKFKDFYRASIANNLNINTNNVKILNLIENPITILFTVETLTNQEQNFITNKINTVLPISLTNSIPSTEILEDTAINDISSLNILNIFNTQTYIRETELNVNNTYDSIVEIPWSSPEDASKNNWRNLFYIINETDLSLNEPLSDVFIYNNKYYSDKDQWYGSNLLGNIVMDRGREFKSIALDYINHLAYNVFKNDDDYIIFDNSNQLFNYILNAHSNIDIIQKLNSSNSIDTETSLNDIIPYKIFMHLIYNSQQGRDRLNTLISQRTTLQDPIKLLNIGDKLVFNLKINPSSNYDLNNPPKIFGKELTPKTYKIIMTLM